MDVREMDRFATISDADQMRLIEKSKNENTSRSTGNWLKTYKAWAEVREINPNIEEIGPEELNSVLMRFYAELRKRNGKNYEPDSLRVMQAALHRHLVEKRYNGDILNDVAFLGSRNVLEGKARELRAEGMGKKPNARDPLTPEEEELLWKANRLGASDPATLQRTIWYYLMLHMGLRACQEHTMMRIEDFTERVANNGTPFLEYEEDPTKTRNGGLKGKKRLTKPKMFATGGPRCPYKLFKLYVSKRDNSCKDKGRFYLYPIMDGSHHFSGVWYTLNPLGKTKIASFLKDIIAGTSVAQSGKKLSNHSGRKTLVKKLQTAGIPDTSIIKVTGHTHTDGLNAYDKEDETEFQRLTNALQQRQTNPTVPPPSDYSNHRPLPTTPLPTTSTTDAEYQYQLNMAMSQSRITNVLQDPSFAPRFNLFPSSLSNQFTTQQQQPIYNNCTFNVYNKSPPQKKRKRVIFSDSDED